jgi:hypothetical protein
MPNIQKISVSQLKEHSYATIVPDLEVNYIFLSTITMHNLVGNFRGKGRKGTLQEFRGQFILIYFKFSTIEDCVSPIRARSTY